jgi:diguanylate cyclase (GGDEF)-like protein
MIGSVIISLYSHNKLPGIYRRPSRFLLAGVFLVVLVNLLQITGINGPAFDISIVGASIAVITAYFAVVRSKGVDFITSARDEIYDYLSEGIIVLNDERYVVYINTSAKRMLDILNLSTADKSYDQIFESAVGKSSNIEAAPADEDGLDMTFLRDSEELIHNISEKPIKDNSGSPLGTFIVISEVTKNRAIINKLENIGGIDALTGLANRRSIERFMTNIDDPKRYPIGVILGDIDKLKQVNDNLGHKQGDALIRLVSEIMTDACPTRGRVSRIGGDEFLMVIPSTSEEEVKGLISVMERVLDSHKVQDTHKNYMFVPSVSFGYDFKVNAHQSLPEAISKADERMYERKRGRNDAQERN